DSAFAMPTSRHATTVRLVVALLLSTTGRLPAAPPSRCIGAPTPPAPSALARRARVEQEMAWAVRTAPGLPRHRLLDRMRTYGVPGLAIAVIHRHRIDWVASYGWADVARAIPVTDTTRFLPGSISKTVNALAALALVDAGRLGLDDDVNGRLVRWSVRSTVLSRGQPVTLRRLLSHTAGTSVRGFWGYPAGAPIPTLRDVLDGRAPATSAPVRVVRPPGADVAYSGGGTLIVQQLLEDVTGRPYASLVRSSVLAPLGMQCSGMEQPVPQALDAAVARGYRPGGVPIPDGRMVLPEQAAAGMWTTASDLGRLVVALGRALVGEASAPLSSRVAAWMTTPVRAGAPALGLFIRDSAGVRLFEHSAGNQGFSGIIAGVAGRGDGVAVVQNGESAAMLEEVVRTVARVYGWPLLGDPPSGIAGPLPTPPPPSLLEALPGIYRDSDRLIRVTRHGDTLRYQAAEAPMDIRMIGIDRFVTVESATDKRIVRDASGRVVAIARLLNGREVGRARREAPFDPPDQWLDAIVGRYRDPRGGAFRITRSGRTLALVQHGVAQPLLAVSPSRLLAPADFLVRWDVVSDRRGRILALRIDAGAGPERADRVGR
nr:beta-lactamase family protein [Gemmatimonadaceae bacterium]